MSKTKIALWIAALLCTPFVASLLAFLTGLMFWAARSVWTDALK